MLERFMEDLIWKYPDEFFPGRGFKQAERQYRLSDGGRLDVSFRDANNRLWVIEVKAVPIRIDAADQVHRYVQRLRDEHRDDPPIPAVVAPLINPVVREQFDRWGIEHFEISEASFRRVADEHEEVESPVTPTELPPVPRAVSEERTSERRDDRPETTAFFRRLQKSFIERYPREHTSAWKPHNNFLMMPTGLPGILSKWSFAAGRFRAEICLNTRDTTKNRRIFDELLPLKTAIEDELGHTLRWYRVENVSLCRLQSFYDDPASEYDSEEKLVRLIEWGTTEMKRLRDVLLPRIAPLL